MTRSWRLASVLAVVTAVLGVCSYPAEGAVPVRFAGPGVPNSRYVVPPANYLDPYGLARKEAYDIRLYGEAMKHVPPYALGYNPYVPPIYVPVVPAPYYPPAPIRPYPPEPINPYPPTPIKLMPVNPYFNPYGSH